MIGIIGAMDIEVESLKALLKNPKQETISGVQFISGKLGNEEAVIAKSGVGKVFAAICAEAMIITYKPDLIINIGVAGTLSGDIKIGDLVIADSVVQHDMDTTEIGDVLGLLSGLDIVHIPVNKEIVERLIKAVKQVGLNYFVGPVASGDQFVSDVNRKKFISDTFGALACEMEGASIGHVCYVNRVPFGVLRAISDGADDGAKMDFLTFTKSSAQNSINVIKCLFGISEE